MASPKKHLKNTGCRPKNKESYISWAKTLSNLFYLHFHLLCLAGRGLDVLVPPQEEDVLAPEQLLQLQPLLNLLPQDLKNVRRGCGARAHVPEVFNSIKNHIAGTKYCQYRLSLYICHPSRRMLAIVVTCQWEPLEHVSLVHPTPWKDCHPPAGACSGWESGSGWEAGNMGSSHPATERILRRG